MLLSFGKSSQRRGGDYILISRAVLLAFAVAFAAVIPLRSDAWFANYRVGGAVLMVVLTAATAILLLGVSIKWKDARVKRVAAEMVALGFALLLLEVSLRIWKPEVLIADRSARKALVARETAQKLGQPFDVRTISQVVADMRAQGVDALPRISREWPRNPRVRKHLPPGLYLLSHASEVAVVECNESGEYLVWRTDEFGFNNPPGLVAAGAIDIAAVGESATLGHCLPRERSVLGLIRKEFPHTANFGLAGTRTLSQLASFREYVEPLKPRVVLWLVNPPYADPKEEADEPLLRRYLDPAFSQGLLNRQPEVDHFVRKLAIRAELQRQQIIDSELATTRLSRIDRVLRLTTVRSRLTLGDQFARPPPQPDFRLFVRTLRLVKQTTEAWGGRLIVVVLPSFEEVVDHSLSSGLRHETLVPLVKSLGIPVINGPALFLRQPDPARFFSMRLDSHPNQHGYALLATAIIRHLRDELSTAVPATELTYGAPHDRTRSGSADTKHIREGFRPSAAFRSGPVARE